MKTAALEGELSALGFTDLRRLVGGWQSVAVYEARFDDLRVAVKVLDPQLVDLRALRIRLEVQSALAAATDIVCAPVMVGDGLVHEITVEPARTLYLSAQRFADGSAPNIDVDEQVVQLGRRLAELHVAMASLPPVDLPTLAAFPAPSTLGDVANQLAVPRTWLSAQPATEPRQLLHGDFSAANLRVDAAAWKVFDFDDCGYGTIGLDLANSLYFVLFDDLTTPGRDRYRHFRDNLLHGYHDRSGDRPADSVLDHLITHRVLTLASWLAHPQSAPPGLRTASPQWRTTLQDFIHRYLETLEPPR